MIVGIIIWLTILGNLISIIPALSALIGVMLIFTDRVKTIENSGLRTVVLAADPNMLAKRRQSISEELAVLEEAQDLQRSVFEVSAELVGCVDEADARLRFAAAVRRYWHYSEVDLALWERGSWRGLGGPIHGDVPALGAPVMLPGQDSPDF